MKYNTYNIERLSKKAKENLPEILNSMGYEGRYRVNFDSFLQINSVRNIVGRAFHLAEEKAHGEKGHLVRLKMVSHSEIWIPETEASTLEEAYTKAFEHMKNGYPVDRDPQFYVSSPDEVEDTYLEEWQVNDPRY